MNILTFDTEEWFNYAQFNGKKGNFLPDVDRVQNELLDTLDEHQIKATFFVLGVVAREYPYVVRNIVSRGHQVGCHSDTHHKLWEFSERQLREDTRLALDSIEQLVGQKVTTYRAPAFSVGKENVWAFNVLAEYGITTDCSVFPGVRDFGGFPEFTESKPCVIRHDGVSLRELPISLTTIFGKKLAYSGGGYFRMLPYGMIANLMDKSDYNMMYLHVHDFNGNQKRILSLRYVKNYYGNKRSFPKLNKFLNDYDFINVEKADEIIEWNNVPQINI